MPKNPLVTVVTCTFNKFDTILSTIESVLLQDYPEIEYIIADDGSQNFPYDTICNYIECKRKDNLKDFRIIRNEENLGTVKNINSAFKSAKGKYIVVLSGDDIFFSDGVISKVINEMEKRNSMLLITTRLVCDQKFKPQYFLPHRLFHSILKKFDTAERQYGLFVSGQDFAMASGSAMYYRKEYLDKNGYFDERYMLWEDGPFLEHYLRKNKIDMAYEIVSIKYQLGGISTAECTNEKLLRDSQLFDDTDRINNLGEINHFYKALTLYNLKSKSMKGIYRVKMIVLHPIISMYKLIYRAVCIYAKYVDRQIVKRRLEVKYAGDKICISTARR